MQSYPLHTHNVVLFLVSSWKQTFGVRKVVSVADRTSDNIDLTFSSFWVRHSILSTSTFGNCYDDSLHLGIISSASNSWLYWVVISQDPVFPAVTRRQIAQPYLSSSLLPHLLTSLSNRLDGTVPPPTGQEKPRPQLLNTTTPSVGCFWLKVSYERIGTIQFFWDWTIQFMCLAEYFFREYA